MPLNCVQHLRTCYEALSVILWHVPLIYIFFSSCRASTSTIAWETCERTLLSTGNFIFFSVHQYKQPLSFACFFIVKYMQGLRLFNLDIIREHGTRDRFYVIDINYFPGKSTFSFLFCDVSIKICFPTFFDIFQGLKFTSFLLWGFIYINWRISYVLKACLTIPFILYLNMEKWQVTGKCQSMSIYLRTSFWALYRINTRKNPPRNCRRHYWHKRSCVLKVSCCPRKYVLGVARFRV